MSTIALPSRRTVLADRVFPRNLATDIALVLGGAVFTALLAQVYIPLPLVPITGQTAAVLLVGATLGAVRGASSLALYALLGVVGVPVYSEGRGGVDVILGATGGYIVGFILAAALVGWLSERQWDRKFLKALAVFVLGTAVPFAIGLPWLAVVAQLDLSATLANGLYPFIIPGLIKAVFVAALLPAAWWAADRSLARRSDDDETAPGAPTS